MANYIDSASLTTTLQYLKHYIDKQDLTYLNGKSNDLYLKRNGSNTITGDIRPDIAVTRSLGTSLYPFRGLYTASIGSGNNDLNISAGSYNAIHINADNGRISVKDGLTGSNVPTEFNYTFTVDGTLKSGATTVNSLVSSGTIKSGNDSKYVSLNNSEIFIAGNTVDKSNDTVDSTGQQMKYGLNVPKITFTGNDGQHLSLMFSQYDQWGNGASLHLASDQSDAWFIAPLIKATRAFQGNLQGNATTATTASKLSTVNKTAWGQTFWTSDGVPTSISGNISNTGTITPSANNVSDIGSSNLYYRVGYINTIYSNSATLSGSLSARDINFYSDTQIIWNRNSDYASIRFKNTGDADNNSYMYFNVGDNGDEYFKFSQTGREIMNIKLGGVEIKKPLNVSSDVYGTRFHGPLTGNVSGNATSADTVDTNTIHSSSAGKQHYLLSSEKSTGTQKDTIYTNSSIYYTGNRLYSVENDTTTNEFVNKLSGNGSAGIITGVSKSGNTISVSSISQSQLKQNLGLSQALTFRGVIYGAYRADNGTAYTMSALGLDKKWARIQLSGGSYLNAQIGDVLIDKSNSAEYLITGVQSLKSGSYAFIEHLGQDVSFIPISGGTMTGALNFANATKNIVGDDVAIGDFNRGGSLGIQGLTGVTTISLLQQGAEWNQSANIANIKFDGSNVIIDKTINGTLNGNASSANKVNHKLYITQSINNDKISFNGESDITVEKVKFANILNAAEQYNTSSTMKSGTNRFTTGLTWHAINNGNYPGSHRGNSISINGDGESELFMGWNGDNSSITNHLYYRSHTNGTGNWGSWVTILDNSNYNNYAPTKTGVGASGTWRINITGNANSVGGRTLGAIFDSLTSNGDQIVVRVGGTEKKLNIASILNDNYVLQNSNIKDNATTDAWPTSSKTPVDINQIFYNAGFTNKADLI